jgi:hypothetical protein
VAGITLPLPLLGAAAVVVSCFCIFFLCVKKRREQAVCERVMERQEVTTETIESFLNSFLRPAYPFSLLNVYLFGSRLHRNAKPSSDWFVCAFLSHQLLIFPSFFSSLFTGISFVSWTESSIQVQNSLNETTSIPTSFTRTTSNSFSPRISYPQQLFLSFLFFLSFVFPFTLVHIWIVMTEFLPSSCVLKKSFQFELKIRKPNLRKAVLIDADHNFHKAKRLFKEGNKNYRKKKKECEKKKLNALRKRGCVQMQEELDPWTAFS